MQLWDGNPLDQFYFKVEAAGTDVAADGAQYPMLAVIHGGVFHRQSNGESAMLATFLLHGNSTG
ncbi:MAG TPA: hypothetical protein PLL20_12970 [Phycisphaerae bacterium]|nr:hypothetical protein [Phycisphaerae bacterium]HRR85842.1 hypothetical protein [Phycisphaerae bacterium]